jgi:hypothetical protein
MPGNRKDKYFPKCIVEYIDVGMVSCPGKRRFKYFRKCILRYIVV